MRVGVQFTGTIAAGRSKPWFTYRWPQQWHVVWSIVPASPRSGAPQIEWYVAVERASSAYITYWITIKNVSPDPVNIEARYAVLN